MDSIVEAKGMGKEYQEGGKERERPRSNVDKETGEKGENLLDLAWCIYRKVRKGKLCKIVENLKDHAKMPKLDRIGFCGSHRKF